MFSYRLSIGVLALSLLPSLPAVAHPQSGSQLGISDKTENAKQCATNIQSKVKTAQDSTKK